MSLHLIDRIARASRLMNRCLDRMETASWVGSKRWTVNYNRCCRLYDLNRKCRALLWRAENPPRTALPGEML